MVRRGCACVTPPTARAARFASRCARRVRSAGTLAFGAEPSMQQMAQRRAAEARARQIYQAPRVPPRPTVTHPTEGNRSWFGVLPARSYQFRRGPRRLAMRLGHQ